MIFKRFHRVLAVLQLGVLLGFCCGILLSSGAQAATSTSYDLQADIQEQQGTASTNYSLCSEITHTSVSGSSTSYQLMPDLNCTPQQVVEEPASRRRQCGNGRLDFPEQCDDGNRLNGDGCSAGCEFELEPQEPPVPPIGGGGGTPGPTPDPDPDPDPEPPVDPEEPEVPEPTPVPEEPEDPEEPVEPTPELPSPFDPEFETEPEEPELPDLLPASLIPEQPELRPAAPLFPPTTGEVVLPAPVEAGEPLLGEGTPYLTNDLTTLFFEQFPEGSGDYDIQLYRDGELQDIDQIKVDDEGYFSFQVQEDLPDGYYEVRVTDRQIDGKTLRLLLEVKKNAGIIPPLMRERHDQLLHSEDDVLVMSVFERSPILRGETIDPARVVIASELLQQSFVLATDELNAFAFQYPGSLVMGQRDRLTIVALYHDGRVSREQLLDLELAGLRGAAPVFGERGFSALFYAYLSVLAMLLLAAAGLLRAVRLGKVAVLSGWSARVEGKNWKYWLKAALALALVWALMFFSLVQALAATTTPNIIPYNGILKDSGGTAISTAQDFRFSIWLDGDFTVGVDRDGAGAIPGGAPGFSGFSEVHAITPDTTGFFSLNIGSVSGTIPDFNITSHLFLQVEVKPSGSPDTSYETLDIDGTDNATDRQDIGTMPYARNSDFIDNREIGTSSGDIAILGAGDVFPTVFIPGGTNADIFEIDADDNAPGNIQLSFGDTLNNQILEWDPNGVAVADGWFNFTDDVNIGGNLTVTGTINGVTIGSKNKSIQLQPEYPNTTYDGDGTNNRGKLEAFFVDTDGAAAPNNFNFYRWTTRNATLQDFDIVVRFRLPDDFTSFQATPMVLRYRTADGNVANNRIDVSVEDTTGTVVPGMAGNTALTSAAAFATTNITFGGGTFTAGSEITIKITSSALTGSLADVSELTINYVGQ